MSRYSIPDGETSRDRFRPLPDTSPISRSRPNVCRCCLFKKARGCSQEITSHVSSPTFLNAARKMKLRLKRVAVRLDQGIEQAMGSGKEKCRGTFEQVAHVARPKSHHAGKHLRSLHSQVIQRHEARNDARSTSLAARESPLSLIKCSPLHSGHPPSATWAAAPLKCSGHFFEPLLCPAAPLDSSGD